MFNQFKKRHLALSVLLATSAATQAEELSYFKHFIEPTKYTPETHKGIGLSDSYSTRELSSSVDHPIWQKFNLKHLDSSSDWKSIKWYGVIVRDFGIPHSSNPAADKAIADRANNLDKILNLEHQVILKTTGLVPVRQDIPGLFNVRLDNLHVFAGKVSARLVKDWVYPLPEDYPEIQPSESNSTFVRGNGVLGTPQGLTETTRVYLIEYSANIPTTKLQTGRYFVTVNPLINESELPTSEAKTKWQFVVNDFLNAEKGFTRGKDGRELTPQAIASSYTTQLRSAIYNTGGRPVTETKANSSASIGLFDEVLENVPTLKKQTVSDLYNDTKVKESENAQLVTEKQNLTTELATTNQQLSSKTEQVNQLTVEVDQAISEAATLTIQKQQLQQQKNNLSSANAALQNNLNQANTRIANITGFQEGNVFRIKRQDSSMCLDVFKSRANNGNVMTYHCHNGANQKWVYNPTTGQIKSKLGNFCLDIGGTFNSGANVKTWQCLPYGHRLMKNQSFIFNGHLIHSKANPRIVIDSTGAHNGANVHMYNLHDGGNQRFSRIK